MVAEAVVFVVFAFLNRKGRSISSQIFLVVYKKYPNWVEIPI